MIGTALQNTLTGQNTGTKIVSYIPPGEIMGAISNTKAAVNGSRDAAVNCNFTLDTGADYNAKVTFFANGNLGVTGN